MIGAEESRRSIQRYKEGRIAFKQDALINEITRINEKAKQYLKSGVDTTGIDDELEKIRRLYQIAIDGIHPGALDIQTSRNLTISSKLIVELVDNASRQKSRLDKYYNDLVNFRVSVDSLSSDSALYSFSSDSFRISRYIQKVRVLIAAVRPTDSILSLAHTNVQNEIIKANLLLNSLNSTYDEIENYRKDLSKKILDQELPRLGQPTMVGRSLRQTIHFSWGKGITVFRFYLMNNIGKCWLLFLLIVIVCYFLYSLKDRISKLNLPRDDFAGQLVFKYPWLSAIMIVLNLFQFLFVNPPFIIDFLFWFIPALCLTIIFWNYIVSYWRVFWVIMFLLFLTACADNLILDASITERWWMAWVASAGVISGSFFLFNKRHKTQLWEQGILFFIAFLVVLEFASVVGNFYGRYNLSKTLFTSGYFSLIIAISFLWTVRMINQGLFYAFELYKVPERKSFYINFSRVGNKVPFFFYLLLMVGWFVLVARNFYVYRFIAGPVEEFLFGERTLGKYTFTVSSILVFFLILVLSLIASRIVSFFTSNENIGTRSHKGGTGLGSWLLLVRIAIISLGLFLALAAAGIPTDRITIVLGALSVGIGFGLQTLINNLVSGLIIAFEKPVNVGDIVEIAGQSGTMKSIGFRSSVISTWDGSSVIIPNGALLNEHLINWTLDNNRRRVTITVGVAYGSDLKKVIGILKNTLNANEKILKYPEPGVLYAQFNSSSVDVLVIFWVNDFRDWAEVRSMVISSIDEAFKLEGIVIPFPQQDIHFHKG